MDGAMILQSCVTVVVAVFASSGLWAFLQKISDKKDAKTKLLLGLAHDRIMFLGMSYIERGHITQGEYENLNDYLYTPYKEMGGNGSAARIMQAVDRLEIRNM